MNVRQLKYFVGVVQAGNINRAADHLHVAQTALGMQIRQLEEDLGVALLVRRPRGIEPTRPQSKSGMGQTRQTHIKHNASAVALITDMQPDRDFRRFGSPPEVIVHAINFPCAGSDRNLRPFGDFVTDKVSEFSGAGWRGFGPYRAKTLDDRGVLERAYDGFVEFGDDVRWCAGWRNYSKPGASLRSFCLSRESGSMIRQPRLR
jgi:hypothetical protein